MQLVLDPNSWEKLLAYVLEQHSSGKCVIGKEDHGGQGKANTKHMVSES